MTGSRAQVIMEKHSVSRGVTNHVPGFMGFLTKLWGETQQPWLSAVGHNVFMLLSVKGAFALKRKTFSPFQIYTSTNTQAPDQH